MGGQRRGLQEVQQKRAKRAEKRASRKKGASSDEVTDKAAVRRSLDAEERKEAGATNERGLDVSEIRSERQNDQEIEKKGVKRQKTRSNDDGSSEAGKERDGEDQSIQKTDGGTEKAEGTMTARSAERNGSSKVDATSKSSKVDAIGTSSKLKRSSNSSIVSSSLLVDTTWTCYAPTCTKNNPDKKSEATNDLCYSPSCRFSSNILSHLVPQPTFKSVGEPEYSQCLRLIHQHCQRCDTSSLYLIMILFLQVFFRGSQYICRHEEQQNQQH